MSKTLEEIRKKLQALDTRKGGSTSGFGDKTTYPHWNMPEGTSSTVRFLPDKNENNIFFWAEKQIIKLPFAGILGHDEQKPVEVQVPCVEMWRGKNSCPILNEVRPMWKDKSLEDIARKYWIKKTYYAQGFVKTDPIGESDTPENPIRKFIIGPQIFTIMKAALMDPDMENSPVDYINGTDFIMAKTSKGGYADYSTSKWARKESSLTEDQLEAIEKYGLVDLSTYLPKEPTAEHLNAMYEMFQASLDGELYDPSRWAQFYKPYGFDGGSSGDDDDTPRAKPTASARPATVQVPARPTPAPTPAPTATVVVEETTEGAPWESSAEEAPAPVAATAAAADKPKSPQEILAMIRNRKTS